MTYEPGTRFMYQTGATYLLAAIVTRITGERLLDHVTRRVLAPMGIDDATWERSPQDIDAGGFGLSLATEQLAAFGQLVLQQGVWQGRQLVPATWFATATSTQVQNGDAAFPSDWTQGYGFQFWRSRHGAYRGDGAFGQLCLVLPDQRAVVAVTAGLEDMQDELDVVWETLLPALGDAETLPPDPDGHRRLTERLAALSLPTPDGAAASLLLRPGARVRCAIEGDVVSSLGLASSPDGLGLELQGPGLDIRATCGHGRWAEDGRSATDMLRTGTDRGPSPLAGSYAWLADDRLAIRVWATDTALRWDIEVGFVDELVELSVCQNVAFTSPLDVRAIGVMEPAG